MKKLQTKYEKFIHYAISTCTSFSLNHVIDHFEDLVGEPKGRYAGILRDLEPYLIKTVELGDDWSPYTGTNYPNADIHYYRCCYATEMILRRCQSVFDWCYHNDLPDELCFHRGKSNWYYCVAHENEDRFNFMTKEDIEFFKEAKIDIYHWEKSRYNPVDNWTVSWDSYIK